MNCHLFYLHLRRVGLPEKQANRLTNGAKQADLGDYENTMLQLVKHGASIGTILSLCTWAKRNGLKPSWVAKRAVLFSKYRALGDEMIMKEIHEQVVR